MSANIKPIHPYENLLAEPRKLVIRKEEAYQRSLV